MCMQIADGMSRLHELEVIHRDLSARNIMVFQLHVKGEEAVLVKVSDYGLSLMLDGQSNAGTSGATSVPIRWMAPEAISHRSWSKESDVWSFGVLMWEIFSKGQYPYYMAGSDSKAGEGIVDGSLSLQKPAGCPAEVWQMMEKHCLNRDMSHRSSFVQLKVKLRILYDKVNGNDRDDSKKVVTVGVKQPRAKDTSLPFASADADTNAIAVECDSNKLTRVRSIAGTTCLSPSTLSNILGRILCDKEEVWTLLQELSTAGAGDMIASGLTMICHNRGYWRNQQDEVKAKEIATTIVPWLLQHEKITRDKAIKCMIRWIFGACYQDGIYVIKDEKKGFGYYQEANETVSGVPMILNSLGYCYQNGWGVEQSYGEAVRYYKLAADQGDAYAQSYLGYCYEKGEGVAKSYDEAARYYKLAADQGQAVAQYNLGICYDNGRGVEQSYGEAARYYKMAAEQGYADAQSNLGNCYENGQGVTKNVDEAVKYYKLAADQGNEDAKRKFVALEAASRQ